jgi:hypothetical protein
MLARRWFHCPSVVSARFVHIVLGLSIFAATLPAAASLPAYDQAISDDASSGLTPLATLTNPVTLTGSNRAAFHFGNTSGDVTMEFILEGNPAAGPASGYLAVGANTVSNLRYKQWNNTGQLGFTQLGVLDYLFSPAVPSPVQPTHIAYVWNASSRTMMLYVNGSIAGSRSSVDANFAMPTGQGWLGANPSNTENMVGTIHRVTVYNQLLPADVIQRHSDAFHGVVRLPIIVSFRASPEAIFTPESATLLWTVERAAALFINGADVTAAPHLTVAPTETTVYTLIASNAAGIVTSEITLLVNPEPVIHSFRASRTFASPGENIALSWNTSYGQTFSITGIGDVTAQTADGSGTIQVEAAAPVIYTLAVQNAFGTRTAEVSLQIAAPANHLVISEFMADNESTLADDDGDFSDWIEIFNPTGSAVGLAGYFLTDNASNPLKWAFPDVTIPPGAYLVVFASGKNRTNSAAPLHTNFRLDNAGEYLALAGPGPVILHAFAPAFPPQRNDVSYGIFGGDVSLARYMGVPTPGGPNDETPPPPGRVQFSRPSGTFAEPFQVALTSGSPDAEIRYTLDGSTPTRDHGVIYGAPITVGATMRVRAVAIVEGQLSRVSAASYIKLAPELANYTSPLPILVIENFGAGVIPQKGWSGTGAGIKQVPRQPAVWAAFERMDGASSLAAPPQMLSAIGIRGRGAFSSQWRQKPYSVEAIDEHGEERNVSPLGLPAHSDWVLYFPDPDTNKDPTLLFNTFAYELSGNTGNYAVRFRWVEAFVNEDGGDLRLADRRGVYAIMEKVSRGKDRLDFQRLSTDGASGGWLLNINRMDPEPATGWPAANGATQPWFFHTAGENRIQETPPNTAGMGDDEPRQSNGFLNFDNPNGYIINPAQRAAIENWFRQFEDVLWNNTLWRHPVNGYRKYIDPVDFADYFVLNVLTRNGDGLLISMFPWKGDDGKLRMGPAWDYNWSSYQVSGGPTGSLMHRSDRLWYRRLFADPDFLQLYIDRWWDFRRGPMSNAAMDAIIDRQAAEITPEKALLNGLPSTAEWANRLTQMKNWLKDRANWIDGNYIRPPAFNVPGGLVPDGFQLVMVGTNGTIYVTTDGTDPRASGGAVASGAFVYQGPVPIEGQGLVQARIRNGTNWSGLTSAVFHTAQDLSTLAVTEIMYHPPAFGGWSSDDLEFLELKNTGLAPLDLGHLTFTAGITFTFTNGTRLEPAEFFVLARNPVAFQSRYPGVPVNGVYSGRLDNGGETVRLSTALGATVFSITYNDRAPWPVAADGYGFSLVPRDSSAARNSDDGAQWRGSAFPGGSPGADDPPSTIPPVFINEVLSHPEWPQVAFVELFNPAAHDVHIGGWFLSNDGAAPRKFRIPDGTVISAGGFMVFTEADFNPAPATVYNFTLDAGGGSLCLVSGDDSSNLTGYSHGMTFDAAARGVSFGRYVNSIGEEFFPAQLDVSPGLVNPGPVIGPVVISEIHYHPLSGSESEAGGASSDPGPSAFATPFLELKNITSFDVPLFDPEHPANVWRVNGIAFAFPPNTVLRAHGLLLIVADDPEAFRARHNLAGDVQVFGPYGGVLQKSGERLRLQRPGEPGPEGVRFITVDEVTYKDRAPWPRAADGAGASLSRRAVSEFGNDPTNWAAALPNPGQDFSPGEAPVIATQPQSQTIVAYQPAIFHVSAGGAEPLHFQWLFNGDPIPGATGATLVLANTAPSAAGRYRAVALNAAGSDLSASAVLTIRLPAVIQQQPQHVITNAGRTVSFSVSATGTGTLRYQWQFEGGAIPEATNATLTLADVQFEHAGIYTVVITDDVGPMLSAPARLTVLIDPVIVQPPLSQVVVPGANVTLSIVVTNTATLPLGYRLRRNNVTLQETFVALHAHTAFFTITNAQPPFTNYAIIVTNAARPVGFLSSSAILTFAADRDGDGLPDFWEEAHGLDPDHPGDAALDSDEDGMSNLEEYLAGTDPRDSSSYLKLEAAGGTGAVTLHFGAISNRTYTIEHTDSIGGAWSRLTDFPARTSNRVEHLSVPVSSTHHFFRAVTPRAP